MMAVLHFSFWSLNLHLRVTLRQVRIRSMQHVLVALQYKEVSCYSILIKSNFWDLAFWIPFPWMPGAVSPFVGAVAPFARGRRSIRTFLTPLIFTMVRL